ncbi:MAG: hypothetical protein OXG84_02910 [Chloroflexi bacterium]|nr:hypothetical protein [Chloroflexota bacterium]
MSIQYPQEILDQQARVRKELEKLAKMRTDYLKSTGQMPPSAAKVKSASTKANRVAASTSSNDPEIVAS